MQSNLARCHKRLQKELEDLEKYKEQLTVAVDTNKNTIWKITFKGADNTLYTGEEFILQFKFSPEYVIKYNYSQLIALK
jgi:ubiquitin-conjugating enzyme E2 W